MADFKLASVIDQPPSTCRALLRYTNGDFEAAVALYVEGGWHRLQRRIDSMSDDLSETPEICADLLRRYGNMDTAMARYRDGTYRTEIHRAAERDLIATALGPEAAEAAAIAAAADAAEAAAIAEAIEAASVSANQHTRKQRRVSPNPAEEPEETPPADDVMDTEELEAVAAAAAAAAAATAATEAAAAAAKTPSPKTKTKTKAKSPAKSAPTGIFGAVASVFRSNPVPEDEPEEPASAFASATGTSSPKSSKKAQKWAEADILDQFKHTELVPCQQRALTNVFRSSKAFHDEALPKLKERVEKIGFDPAVVDETLAFIREDCPIIVHFHLERYLDKFLADTHYRNLFETSVGSGNTCKQTRVEWEKRLFGDAYGEMNDCKASERCKYGSLNAVNDPQGVKACLHYGSSYLKLKDVRWRTTFSNSDTSGLSMRDLSTCEYYAHVLNSYNDHELAEALLVGPASGQLTTDSRAIATYKECQIHGDVRFADHIEAIYVDASCNTKQWHHKIEMFAKQCGGAQVVYMEPRPTEKTAAQLYSERLAEERRLADHAARVTEAIRASAEAIKKEQEERKLRESRGVLGGANVEEEQAGDEQQQQQQDEADQLAPQ